MTRRRRRNGGKPYTVRKNAPKKKTKTRNLNETNKKALLLPKESLKAVRDPNQILKINQSEVGEDDSGMTGSCEKISSRPHPPRKLKVRESEIIQKLLLKHGDNVQKMVMDLPLNPFQLTFRQLEKQIESFQFWGPRKDSSTIPRQSLRWYNDPSRTQQRMYIDRCHYRVPASSGYDNSFPSIRLRGLPFHVTEDDIRLFLAGETVDILMVKREGRFTGEAYVILGSPLLVDVALMKNKSYMGRRYIEIFRAKKLDYYRAIVAEMTEGPVPHTVTDPRPRQALISETGHLAPVQKPRMSGSTILRLRGLPFKVTDERIVQWFNNGTQFATPLRPENVFIVADYGRPSGTAFVEFATPEDAQNAMSKDRQMLGTRYIEIFESSTEERARYTSQ